MSSCGFCCSGGPHSENKRKRKDRKILEPCQRTEKKQEHEDDGSTSCSWCTWDGLQMLRKMTGRIGNNKKKRNCQGLQHCSDLLVYSAES